MTEVNSSINPLITIITVVFNGEDTIIATINSVIEFRKQYQNVEYIIIDGGSVDKTKEILLGYNKEINLLISEPDNGIYDAMNKGWNEASDSYILFLGSGDTIVEFPKQLPLNNEKISAFYGDVSIGETQYILRMGWRFKVGNNIHHQALLIHKSSFPVSPFNLEYTVYADYDLNMRLYKHGLKFIYLDNFRTYAYPNGLSSNVKIGELLTVVRRNFGVYWAVLAFGYRLQKVIRNLFRVEQFYKKNIFL